MFQEGILGFIFASAGFVDFIFNFKKGKPVAIGSRFGLRGHCFKVFRYSYRIFGNEVLAFGAKYPAWHRSRSHARSIVLVKRRDR